MPLFEFECAACHHTFEELVKSSSDTEGVRCPSCGGAVERKMSTFAGRMGASKSELPAACPNRGCCNGACAHAN